MVFIASCAKDSGLPISDSGPDDRVDSSRLVDVKYSEDIQPILVTYCLGVNGQGCHVTNTNTGSNGVFESYEGLLEKVNNGSIQSRVLTVDGGMPPSYTTGPKKLTATDLAIFKKWVSDGALNN